MGGVQFSSFYFLKEIQHCYPDIETQLFLPRRGQFSKLCEKNLIPFLIYNSPTMQSSSVSFFHDSIRIPNPFAWIYNIINIYNISKSIQKLLKPYHNTVILSKGLYSHIIMTIANRKLSNKLIWHLQDLISSRFGGILIKLMNHFAKLGPNYIICDGKSIFKSLNNYNQSKATIILNGIKADLFQRTNKDRKSGRKEFNIPKNAYVIGHVGRFTPWKGQVKLVEAFIEYSKQNSKAILLLVGAPTFDSDSYLNQIKKKISKCGLNDKIILTGFRSDLNKMYSMMDLFIYPSTDKDTSPLALIGALSSGLPVAVSSIESLEEIIEIFPEISLFNPLRKSEIINIFWMFEIEQMRIKVSNSIKSKFKNHFAIKIHIQNMMKAINEA